MAALSAQRWQEVAPHLDRALDLADTERATWLATIRAQDPSLAADLQSLLDEHQALAQRGFLEHGPGPLADQRARPTDPFGLVGQTLEGRFRVERQVAEGGFGIVYRAHQLVLDRAVALKVLKTPENMTAAQRTTFHRTFEEEGRTIARLKHPNIVDVHDFGVSERGQGGPLLWMALEWLEGKTLEVELAERAAGTPMTPAEALSLLRPVLQTIGYAHRQQVVHRDLKPANIFLAERDGAVTFKVLDFGIAKIMAGGDEEGVPGGSHTTKGPRAFSPDYAAPEQISYGRTGPWTDVHALGLILTQMLTGRRPYDGIHPDRFAAALAERRPSPAAAGHPAGKWEPVLARAMALRPADRYQSADELLEALENSVSAATAASAASPPAAPNPAGSRLPLAAALAALTVVAVAGGGYFALRTRVPAAPAVAADRIVLAVLPFRNLTGDLSLDTLSDGLTEGVIGQLGRLGPEQLSVISRTAMTRYKGTGKSAAEIGHELRAGYLLDANVKRQGQQGNELRVDASVVRVSDQVTIFSDSFTAGREDVQGLQNDLARGVAKGIRLKLGATAEMALVRKRPVKPAAYEAYLRARYTMFDGKDGLAKGRLSLAAYEEAITIDPTFALAHAGLAMVSLRLIGPGFGTAAEIEKQRLRTRAAALRAVDLDPDLPQAQAALGAVLYQVYWDWPAGERHLLAALKLDPNQGEALEIVSQLWITVGRFAEAIAARTRAVELDPLSSFVSRQLGNAYYYARQYDAAIDVLERTVAADEKFLPARKHLMLSYVAKGMFAAAAAQEDRSRGQANGDVSILVGIGGYVLAKAGRVDEARRIIDRLIEQGKGRNLPAFEIARVHVGLGEREEALRWLDKAVEQRELNVIFLRIDPIWDPVRADPRFTELIRRVGIPPLAGGG